jgi:hypothetical protein
MMEQAPFLEEDFNPSKPQASPIADAPWPQIDEAAFYGLAGDIVKTIKPHTEADPIAVLLQVLIFAGNIIGRIPYYKIEADQHHTNLFGVLVGRSSKGRRVAPG